MSVNLRGLTFTSGQSFNNMSTQCTELVVLDDNILEDNETFSVRLTSQSSEVLITVVKEQAQVVIMEDNFDCEC